MAAMEGKPDFEVIDADEEETAEEAAAQPQPGRKPARPPRSSLKHGTAREAAEARIHVPG